VFIEGWRLGKPDIVIDIGQDFEIKPGKDAYEHFTVPTNFTEGRWIRAAEIRPGNRRVVHHVHVSVVADERQAGSTSIESMTALKEFMVRDGTLTRPWWITPAPPMRPISPTCEVSRKARWHRSYPAVRRTSSRMPRRSGYRPVQSSNSWCTTRGRRRHRKPTGPAWVSI
jgi:hypothetical protein